MLTLFCFLLAFQQTLAVQYTTCPTQNHVTVGSPETSIAPVSTVTSTLTTTQYLAQTEVIRGDRTTYVDIGATTEIQPVSVFDASEITYTSLPDGSSIQPTDYSTNGATLTSTPTYTVVQTSTVTVETNSIDLAGVRSSYYGVTNTVYSTTHIATSTTFYCEATNSRRARDKRADRRRAQYAWQTMPTALPCPAGQVTCPVAASSSQTECVDPLGDLENCGGCSSAGGVNCLDLPFAQEVSCQAGQCMLHSCSEGYLFNNRCVVNEA